MFGLNIRVFLFAWFLLLLDQVWEHPVTITPCVRLVISMGGECGRSKWYLQNPGASLTMVLLAVSTWHFILILLFMITIQTSMCICS